MYEEADQSPVVMSEDVLENVYVNGLTNIKILAADTPIKIYPNPTMDGQINIDIPNDLNFEKVDLYNLNGQLIQTYLDASNIQISESGMFILKIKTDQGIYTERVVRN